MKIHGFAAAGGTGGIFRDPWMAIAWLLPAASMLFALINVNDLAYLIRAGRVMLETGDIVRRDIFTFTIPGQPWLNQQWGAELVFASVFRAGGWPALVVLRALLVAVAAGWTYSRTRREGASPAVAGPVTLGCLLVAISVPGTLALRAQLLAAPLFLASAEILRARHRRVAALAFLPAIAMLWANLHGSFVLLPALVGMAFLDDLFARRRTARWTGGVVVASLLTPLLTPWGSGVYGYVFELAEHPVVRRVVAEWQPLLARMPEGAVFLGAVALLGVVVVRWGSIRVTPETGLGLALVTGLALWSGRNLVWWALFVPPVVGGMLSDRRFRSDWTRRSTIAIASSLCVFLGIGVARAIAADPPTRLLSDAPIGVTGALQAATDDGDRVFNAGWGSWFELVAPELPMFVDPRVELFPEELWNEYFLVVGGRPGWRAVLDRWRIDAVVVRSGRTTPLLAALASDTGWSVVYRDPVGAVVVRAHPAAP